MARLEEISPEDLRRTLDEFEEKRAMMRVLAAIIYKRGPSVPMIAEWFDVREATVYSWFDRIEEAESIDDAIYDRPRSGRPPRLTENELRSFTETIRESPENAGYEAAEWTPRLARRYLEETYDVRYSLRHVRRMLSEADASR